VIGEISTSRINLPIANAIARDAVKTIVLTHQIVANISSRETVFGDALRELGMQRVTSRLFDS